MSVDDGLNPATLNAIDGFLARRQVRAETWGHWCREQQPTTLPTSTPRCPQCGALNLSAIVKGDDK